MSDSEAETTDSPQCLQLSEEQRFQVLMAELNERYQAWHHMRARSMQFTLWILGLSIAASWKLLQEPCGNLLQRVAATAFVLLLGAAAAYFLKSLARGVRTNREALINVETAIGTHHQGAFLAGKAILPTEYKDTRPRPSSHFRTLYALLAVTSIYLLAAIWFPSDFAPSRNRDQVKSECTSRAPGAASTSATKNAPDGSMKIGVKK